MLVPQEDFLLRFQYLEVMDWVLYQQNSLLLLLVADCLGLPKSPKPRYPVSKQKKCLIQRNPDIVKVDIVKNPEIVKISVLTILLLYCSKITVDIVKNPDLVNCGVLTKIFTISGFHCNDTD